MDPCAINMSVSALACALAKGKTEAEIAALSALLHSLVILLKRYVLFRS